MLITERERMKEDIRAWTEHHGQDRSALLPILEEIQRKYAFISEWAMQDLADLMDIHPVEVYSVVSFYAYLHSRPKGKYIIQLCRTISCDMQGKSSVARQLETDLGITFGQTTPDGKFSLEWANCLGMCDQGPALLVNEQIHTRVTPESVNAIIEECRKSFGIYALEQKEEAFHDHDQH